MKNLWIGAALMFLVACGGVQTNIEQNSRELAKGAVNGVVEQQFPGVNVTPITDCVIDHASLGEILQLAQSAVTGAGTTTSLVLEIASRPATSQCIAERTLGVVLG